jgi:hypothetical protein
MIKDKSQFPLLEVIRFCENGKAVIDLCNEGIESMEEHLSVLYSQIMFASDKQEIMNEIHFCERHLVECIESKHVITASLKTVNIIFN